VIIKVLEHRIYKTEPSILIDDSILINAPSLPKKLAVDHVLLTHSHPENLKGFNDLVSKDLHVHLSREHTHFFNHYVPNYLSSSAQLHTIIPKKKFKVLSHSITPITVQHQVQSVQGKFCLGFLVDDKVMVCSPCSRISKKSYEFFEEVEVLIMDGGYKQDIVRGDHSSISNSLSMFKHSNIKQIYFLGTHRGYHIKGKIKDSRIQIDTLHSGDILRLK